jgi:predicted patatin/cPLA2 family phospholipase
MFNAEESRSFFDRLLIKRQLYRAGDIKHESTRTAVIASGGGMAGIFAAGVLYGLEQSDFSDVFDVAVGVSSGAASLAYFITRQAVTGRSIYTEDLAGNKFIKFQKGMPAVDVDYLEDIFRTKKPLDVSTLVQSRTHLYVTVTDVETCEPVLLSAKKSGDVISAVRASMAMPVRYNVRTPVSINGRLYMDGAISAPVPFAQLLDVYDPTDILIVLNRPLDKIKSPPGFLKRRILKQYLSKLPLRLRTLCLENHLVYNSSIDRVVNRDRAHLRVGIISPDMEIDGLTTDASKLRLYFAHGIEQVGKILSGSKTLE